MLNTLPFFHAHIERPAIPHTSCSCGHTQRGNALLTRISPTYRKGVLSLHDVFQNEGGGAFGEFLPSFKLQLSRRLSAIRDEILPGTSL